MLIGSKSAAAPVFELPGRTFLLLHAPETTGSERISMGIAVFPAGSAPEGHVHEIAEEVVYVLAGQGRLISHDTTVKLEPGVAVCIPPGLHHATVAHPDTRLELLCVFSPPVIPGTYEPSGLAPGGAASHANHQPQE